MNISGLSQSPIRGAGQDIGHGALLGEFRLQLNPNCIESFYSQSRSPEKNASISSGFRQSGLSYKLFLKILP